MSPNLPNAPRPSPPPVYRDLYALGSMLRSFLVVLVAFGGSLVALPIAPAQVFRYEVLAPAEIRLKETVAVEVALSTSGITKGARGAEAWQLALAHEGLDLLSATTEGTVVDELFEEGFQHTELTEGDGNRGFTSVVALSLEEPVSLPPEGSVVVARAAYRAGPEACGGATLVFRDGLEGSGRPVENRVSWEGTSIAPETAGRVFEGCAPAIRRLALETPTDLLVTHPEGRTRFEVQVVLEQDAATVCGWELAVRHDSTLLRLVEVKIEGTGVPELIGGDGHALLEVTQGPGNSGFVAQVELSPSETIVVPELRQSLAIAVYELVTSPEPGEDVLTRIELDATLRGSGGPITTALRPEGILDAAPLELRLRTIPHPPIIRGDANGDGLVDLSDSIATLAHLFLGGGDVCAEAADANGDGLVDVSDPIRVLDHLFLGGVPPEAPFPACGLPPETLGCDRASCR